jgi:sugar phosphate isomerase/epimerase
MFRNLGSEALGINGRQSELIELSLSFGFKGIDLDLVDFQQTVKAHGLAHARRLIDSARLKLGSFRLPLELDDLDETFDADLARLTELAELARQIGLTRARAVISPASDLRPYHENFEFHRRRLAKVGEFFGEYGICVGLEFRATPEWRRDRAFQFIHTFDALAMLVEMVKSDHVGVMADLFEMHVAGNSFDALRKLGGSKIVGVILSDAPADKPAADCTSGDRLLPAETGSIDAAAALVTLAEMEFTGPITPAVSPEQTRGIRREQVVKTAGERLSQVWSSAGLTPKGTLAPAAKP